MTERHQTNLLRLLQIKPGTFERRIAITGQPGLHTTGKYDRKGRISFFRCLRINLVIYSGQVHRSVCDISRVPDFLRSPTVPYIKRRVSRRCDKSRGRPPPPPLPVPFAPAATDLILTRYFSWCSYRTRPGEWGLEIYVPLYTVGQSNSRFFTSRELQRDGFRRRGRTWGVAISIFYSVRVLLEI
ncbi:hypothetical protein GWI33_010374 [Rhynchophorus ferrugineus]|uniref:Uncharacterized protein n=1 Tax=Rhynchophorus ferrugineus TaxID=354439 RepID=A0A834ILT8_RHYFE|nr:hypothetical protein GWI33_010374 [Rhynchophorus ferrugineus]